MKIPVIAKRNLSVLVWRNVLDLVHSKLTFQEADLGTAPGRRRTQRQEWRRWGWKLWRLCGSGHKPTPRKAPLNCSLRPSDRTATPRTATSSRTGETKIVIESCRLLVAWWPDCRVWMLVNLSPLICYRCVRLWVTLLWLINTKKIIRVLWKDLDCTMTAVLKHVSDFFSYLV